MLHLNGAFTQLDDCGFGVDSIAVKYGQSVANVRIPKSMRGAPADIGLAHANHETDNNWAFHQTLPVLRSRSEMFVNVHRMLIHA